MKRILLCVFLGLGSQVSIYASEFQAGWSEQVINKIAVTHSAAMLQQAEQNYYSSSKREGTASPESFPHEEAKASLDELMLCIVRKAAKQWQLIRFRKNEGVYLNQLLQEAYGGGECQPSGLVGRSMQLK